MQETATTSLTPPQLLVHIFEPLGSLKYMLVGVILILSGSSVLGDMALGSYLITTIIFHNEERVGKSFIYKLIIFISVLIALLITYVDFSLVTKIITPLLFVIYPPRLIILITNILNLRNLLL